MLQKLITPPAIEPVTLAEAKLHARVDESLDDTLVTNQIVAARQMVEAYIGGAIITQTWDLFYSLTDKPFCNSYRMVTTMDNFPYFAQKPSDRKLEIPFGPIQSVVSFNSYDSDNTETLFDTSNYFVSDNYIMLNDYKDWPNLLRQNNCIAVRVITGFGDTEASVPFPIKQAILLLISQWYENRGAVYDPMNVSQTPGQLPYSVTAVLQQYRVFAI